MMGFIEWVNHEKKRKEKEEKKNVRSTSQTSQEYRSINHQGQANRYDQEVPEPSVHLISEPR